MNRRAPAFEATSATTVRQDGIDLLAFHGCGYLGLAHDPRVVEAAGDALGRYGASGLASRNTSGSLDLHERLEERLADFLDVEAALVVPDGYLADLATVAALASRVHVALHDADAHASLVDAARASGMERFDYGEGDMSHAMALLDRFKDARPLVLTDGVFAMHGRLASAAELLRFLPDDGVLLVDDSHGVGVLGPHGRGTLETFGLSDERIVLTGSLGKALGSGGGFVAGARETIEAIRGSSASFAGTTALAPPLAAAALAALEIVESEPARRERLTANTGQLHRSARRVGLRSSGTFMPVLRIELETVQAARELSAALHVEGIYAPAIRYPGSEGDGVVRAAVTSEHTAAEIRRLEETLARHLPGGADE
ncbi:MAG: pyridoxal phosphate-dependent aminotransferase family protein [Planctomycetota bacterium]